MFFLREIWPDLNGGIQPHLLASGFPSQPEILLLFESHRGLLTLEFRLPFQPRSALSFPRLLLHSEPRPRDGRSLGLPQFARPRRFECIHSSVEPHSAWQASF